MTSGSTAATEDGGPVFETDAALVSLLEHPVGASSRHWLNAPRPTRGHIGSALLVLLAEHEAHGYELRGRLAEFDLPIPDSGGLYRLLRQMEDDGLVTSRTDASQLGPARRVYATTELGRAQLHVGAPVLAAQRRSLGLVLRRYGRWSRR